MNPSSGENGGTVATVERATGERTLEPVFRALLDAAPDAMVVVGQDGRIQIVNAQAERLFGYGREELVGQPVEILVPPRYRDRHPQHRADYAADPRTRPMGAGLDLRAVRKDGTEFPAEISLSPMDTESGLLVTAAIRDTTERRRAEHKFRALLESAPDAMVIVNRYGNIHLVNAQTEKLFGYPREELLGQPVEILIPEQFPREAPPAPGDGRLLGIVFENLLGNAWKFTAKRAQARIEFGCNLEGEQPVYFVRDNGAGFDMAYASKLFRAFQRLHKAREFEGTGIGLATVERIIRRHGGRIWAEGAVDQGATFYFTLGGRGART